MFAHSVRKYHLPADENLVGIAATFSTIGCSGHGFRGAMMLRPCEELLLWRTAACKWGFAYVGQVNGNDGCIVGFGASGRRGDICHSSGYLVAPRLVEIGVLLDVVT